MKPLPEIGKLYHFFDDGKISNSRHYIAKCLQIVHFEESKNIFFELDGRRTKDEPPTPYKISLYERWKEEVEHCHWLYAKETDYFVAAEVPGYDDNLIWFARTKDGGWFSMNIQSWWQSGRLDVDSAIYNYYTHEYGEDYYTDKIEDYYVNKETTN